MTDTNFAALWKATAKHLAREVREVDAVDDALRQALMKIASERDRAKRAAVTLGRIVERQVEDTLRWACMEDQIGTNDPDQQLAWELCAEMPGKIAALTVERDRYRASLEEIQAMLPGPRTFAESLARDFEGNLWPRTIDADQVAAILTRALNENREEQ